MYLYNVLVPEMQALRSINIIRVFQSMRIDNFLHEFVGRRWNNLKINLVRWIVQNGILTKFNYDSVALCAILQARIHFPFQCASLSEIRILTVVNSGGYVSDSVYGHIISFGYRMCSQIQCEIYPIPISIWLENPPKHYWQKMAGRPCKPCRRNKCVFFAMSLVFPPLFRCVDTSILTENIEIW